MSAWAERILNEFTADLARLWIVADPDAVLLDEQLLSGLRERGFEVLRFEVPKTEAPFEHRDVRAILGSMFVDGTLRPPTLAGELSTLPDWAKARVIRDPGSMRNRVLKGIDRLIAEMPTIESSPSVVYPGFSVEV